jgi:glycosyltransferase involved in cell wall biosynthesis
MGFPSVDRYRQLATELGLSEDVTFTGRIPFEEAPAYLRLGTIAAATKISASEGSGKLLNYMATALPVAAFDTPVHREYLEGHAAYARPGDVDGLAGAMASLLDDPTKGSQQGTALRQRAVSQYSWDAACATIQSVHRLLLQQNH